VRSREEARLERLFRRLLLVSASVSVGGVASFGSIGCGTSGGAAAKDAGALRDATEPVDSSAADATQTGDDDASDAGTSDPDATVDDATADGAATADAADAPFSYGYDDAACNPVPLTSAKCGSTATLPCGLPPDAQVENCYLLVSQCKVLCAPSPAVACGIAECLATEAGTMPDATALTLECSSGGFGCTAGVGRRPAGFADEAPLRSSGCIGAFLAEMARLEAASVFAFRRLRDELSTMRAPKRLVRRAERSARDEVRHARVTSRLARRRGALPAPAVAPPRQPRTVEAFATENAVEGCVRETFGALVATRQASFASDPEVRREMRTIARDETRHAALAWEVARWADRRLDRDARTRVRRAMRQAVESLRAEVATVPHDVARELGVPTGSEARSLVDAFAAAILGGAERGEGLCQR
jgi:hypothetical protein